MQLPAPWRARSFRRTSIFYVLGIMITLLVGGVVYAVPITRDYASTLLAQAKGALFHDPESDAGAVAILQDQASSTATAKSIDARVADLEKQVAGQSTLLTSLQHSNDDLQNQLKDAIAEVIQTNSALQKQAASLNSSSSSHGTTSSSSVGSNSSSSGATASTGSQMVNPNTATLEQLETLPGIGATYAQHIIDYRNQHGPFQTIDDLLNVSGIGESRLDNMRDYLEL